MPLRLRRAVFLDSLGGSGLTTQWPCAIVPGLIAKGIFANGAAVWISRLFDPVLLDRDVGTEVERSNVGYDEYPISASIVAVFRPGGPCEGVRSWCIGRYVCRLRSGERSARGRGPRRSGFACRGWIGKKLPRRQCDFGTGWPRACICFVNTGVGLSPGKSSLRSAGTIVALGVTRTRSRERFSKEMFRCV